MVLPEGLEFLKLGWWLIHILAVLLIWSYAYRKGRLDERKERNETELPRTPRVGDETSPPRPEDP
jgi:hypothetical protein